MNIRAAAQMGKGDRKLKSGRTKDARKAYHRELRSRPNNTDALHRLALLEIDEGQPQAALRPLDRLVKLRPDDLDARLLLAATLEDTGDQGAAEEALRAILRDAPDYPKAYNNLGNILQMQGRFEEALEVFTKATDLMPVDTHWINAGNTLDELGRHGESIDYYSKVLDQRPGFVDAWYYRARARLAVGQAQEALADNKRCLALDPSNQKAIALQGTLFAELGQEDESRRIFDYDKFVRVFRPETPPGFASKAEFHAQVIDYIRNSAELEHNPMDASTRGGWHSQDLLGAPNELMEALKAMLREVFQTYVSDLPSDSSHPFLRHRYAKVQVLAQAQVLSTQGYLLSHIHPGGWVSGAYYLAIPDAVETGEGYPGWLDFGRPTQEIKCTVELETRRHKPEEGTAVLFPSYFFHGTRPFESDSERISLGIDLIPRG